MRNLRARSPESLEYIANDGADALVGHAAGPMVANQGDGWDLFARIYGGGPPRTIPNHARRRWRFRSMRTKGVLDFDPGAVRKRTAELHRRRLAANRPPMRAIFLPQEFGPPPTSMRIASALWRRRARPRLDLLAANLEAVPAGRCLAAPNAVLAPARSNPWRAIRGLREKRCRRGMKIRIHGDYSSGTGAGDAQ